MDIATLMAHAYQVATFSHDPSTQNGSVLVTPDGTIRAVGWNQIPDLTGHRLAEVLADRSLKYPRVIHGEVDAIANAARIGVKTNGLTMIAPWAACLNCAVVMMQAGIKKLIVHGPRMRKGHPLGWVPQVDEALERLATRMDVDVFDEPLPHAPRIRIAEELWQP